MSDIITSIILFAKNNPNIIIGAAVIVAIVFMISIVKKVASLAISIFICGFIFTLGVPVCSQIMENNGVSINGTQLSIVTENGTQQFDLSIVKSFSSVENNDGTYTITIELHDNSQQTIVVPANTAKWIKSCGKLIWMIGKAGSDLANSPDILQDVKSALVPNG